MVWSVFKALLFLLLSRYPMSVCIEKFFVVVERFILELHFQCIFVFFQFKTVLGLINPRIPRENLQTFLFDHIRHDIGIIQDSVAKNEDDVYVMLNLILKRIFDLCSNNGQLVCRFISYLLFCKISYDKAHKAQCLNRFGGSSFFMVKELFYLFF